MLTEFFFVFCSTFDKVIIFVKNKMLNFLWAFLKLGKNSSFLFVNLLKKNLMYFSQKDHFLLDLGFWGYRRITCPILYLATFSLPCIYIPSEWLGLTLFTFHFRFFFRKEQNLLHVALIRSIWLKNISFLTRSYLKKKNLLKDNLYDN